MSIEELVNSNNCIEQIKEDVEHISRCLDLMEKILKQVNREVEELKRIYPELIETYRNI